MYDAGEGVVIQPTMLFMSVSSFLPFRVHENPFDPACTFTPCQGSVFVHERTVSSKGDSFPDEMSQHLLELERISVLSTVAVWRSVEAFTWKGELTPVVSPSCEEVYKK